MRLSLRFLGLAIVCAAGPMGLSGGPLFTNFSSVSFPGSTLTVAEMINNAGTVVGFYNDAAGNTHGFSLAGGIYSTLDFTGASATFAKGINNPGMIVGDAVIDGNDLGFLLSGGTYTPIVVPGADSTDAAGINDTGEIVGSYQTASAAYGFLSIGGSITSFQVPGADDTLPGGINDAGQIVGSYDIGGVNNGFLLSGGSYTTLDFPGASDTFLTGINDLGQITGFYFDNSGNADGFVYSGGTFNGVDYPGALDTYLKGGNDHGSYTGFYDFGGAPTGFTVQMAPEPGTMTLMSAGLLFLLGRKRRRSALLRAAMSRTSLIGLVAVLLGVNLCLHAQPSALSFLYPANNQVVGGANQLLYVTISDQPAIQSVAIDVSLDGVNWTTLPREDAPNFGFGVGSYTTGVDLTQFPVGSVYFRARFTTDSTGPIIVVQNRLLPTVSCRVSRLSALSDRFDCSASTDSNGGIVSYAFDFGDGTSTVSANPSVTHSYPSFGIFPLDVAVTDADGLTSTEYKQLLHLQVDLIQDEPHCGCDQMTVSSTGNSTPLNDPRRSQIVPTAMPLGPDPTYITYNFQITADLTKGSNPAKCTEGQSERGSMGYAGAVEVKMACSAGMKNDECSVNADCDTAPGSGDGVCTAYPNGAGLPRGDDDYAAPNGVTKDYVRPSQIVWIDNPGDDNTHAAVMADPTKGNFSISADFLAFVNTDVFPGKSCSCHFTLTLNWIHATGNYNLATTALTLVNDGETQNCVAQ